MAAGGNPLKYIAEVRAEAKRVTWPSRKETMVTTMMVLALVVVSCMFFFVVDQIVGFGVQTLLKLGR